MHFLKHMVVGRRCGLWKSGGIYKNLLRSQRPFRFHGLVCRAAWCKPQLHRAGLKPGHVEARDWAGTSHQLTNFPQTTLPLPLCWQKFCHLCIHRDYLGRGCTDERRGLGPLWLQILQNSWGWAEEPTGAQSMQNPGWRGCNKCPLRARLPPPLTTPHHPMQLPASRARCLVCHLSFGAHWGRESLWKQGRWGFFVVFLT